MRATRLSLVSSLCLTVPLIIAEPAMAQADAPYGTATFRAYPDIAQVRQLKVLWDFNFSDPEAVRLVLNYVGALIQATRSSVLTRLIRSKSWSSRMDRKP